MKGKPQIKRIIKRSNIADTQKGEAMRQAGERIATEKKQERLSAQASFIDSGFGTTEAILSQLLERNAIEQRDVDGLVRDAAELMAQRVCEQGIDAQLAFAQRAGMSAKELFETLSIDTSTLSDVNPEPEAK